VPAPAKNTINAGHKLLIYIRCFANPLPAMPAKQSLRREGKSMSTGQVKWFNNAKGFGFILPDGGGTDLFAHYSAITMEGYKTLKAGQVVSFDIIEGPKGLHAININAVSDGSDPLLQPSHPDAVSNSPV
jgi:cold shock protein